MKKEIQEALKIKEEKEFEEQECIEKGYCKYKKEYYMNRLSKKIIK